MYVPLRKLSPSFWDGNNISRHRSDMIRNVLKEIKLNCTTAGGGEVVVLCRHRSGGGIGAMQTSFRYDPKCVERD